MSLTAVRPGFLVFLLVGPLLIAAWRRWPPPLPPRRRRLALGVHLAVLALLVMALADLRMQRRPDRRAVVAVVDLSDSTRAVQDQAVAVVQEMMRAKGPDDLFGVVAFGRDAQVELPPTRTPEFTRFRTGPNGTYSDLGGALLLAGNLIPDGYARQVVLVSDGRQNLGDASKAVSDLRERSVRVDVIPIGTPPGAETLVLALEAPPELRPGQTVTASARVRATEPATGKLSLQVDGVAIQVRDVDLPVGVSEQRFEIGPLEPGTHDLGVVLEARPDGFTQNDSARAVVRVLGRPSVLVLEGNPGAGANVRAALIAAGMDVDTRPAREAPTDVAGLARFDSIVVSDTPVESFPEGALPAIATTVRDLGRGLVATGGTEAYGPGAWKDTPLEDALPVDMDLRKPKERPSTAVVLLIEGMESPFGNSVALGAAQAVVDRMTLDDELAMITPKGPDDGQIIVPLARPADKDAIKRAIGAATLNDPSGYGGSLNFAIDMLSESRAASKHVIIMGDGDALGDVGSSTGGRGPEATVTADFSKYDALFAKARAERITLTSIGVNNHSNDGFMSHMRAIGERSGGQFFQSDDVNEVPEVLLIKARAALKGWFALDPFFPRVSSAGDLLEGVPLDAFPQLGGYVNTTAKPTSEVLLTSPGGDPVLAAGQYGLGRAVAWTPDAAGRWTSGFLASPVSSTLFGRMVGWTLPGSQEQIRIDAVPRGDGLDMTVSGPEQGGDLQVQVVSPGQATSNEQLRPETPGRWQGVVPAADVGTYVVHAALKRGGEVVGQTEVLVPVPYSPEYLELGRDETLLRQLAGQGGTLLTRAQAAWSQPNLAITVSSPIFWYLLLLAVLIWPIDIALRRLTLGLGKILAAVKDERFKRRKAAAVAPESLTRLREAVAARRQQPVEGPPASKGSRPPEGTPEPEQEPAPPAAQPAAPSPIRSVDDGIAARMLAARKSRGQSGRGD